MAQQKDWPIERSLEILGHRGSFIVLRELQDGRRRFSVLQGLTGLPPRTLSMRLKELEEQDLVSRTQIPEVPPRVEYALTERGKTLKPALDELSIWSRDF